MRRLRACPVCGSKAVSAWERADAEDGGARLRARCGECWAWRGAEVGRRAADAFERRLRRDRRRMAISSGQGARWRELELERLVQSPQDNSARRTRR